MLVKWLPALLLASGVQAGDFTNAEAALLALQAWYNRTSGLWDTCGWWNGANCMTAIADLAAIDVRTMNLAADVFSNTYSNAPAYNPNPQVSKAIVNGVPVSYYGHPAPKPNMKAMSDGANGNAIGFVDTCYDDDGWWALAWMYAYDLTRDTRYLKTAVGIFDIMSTGGPTNCSNGGIHWCSDSSYVNAIANELYLSVAAHLANRVPLNSTYYTKAAVQQWTWFKSQDFFNAQGLVNDGLTTDCKNNGQTVWSYNQGVIMGALVELYKANGDKTLLDSANTIAHAAIANLTTPNHVIKESCDDSNTCGPDGSQFKGIFARNLAILNRASPNPLYWQVIQASADSIWANDRLAKNDSLSLDWTGPFVGWVNASTHSSAMEALVAQASL